MPIEFPTNTADVIDDIRNAIGRDITIFRTVSGIPCTVSGCNLDPVTGLSTNQFCPVCGGEFFLNTTSGFVVNAHIYERNNVDKPVWVSAGTIVEGDAIVQIKFTPANIDAVENAESYLVNGKDFIQEDFSLRGVPELNRIVISLVEREG